MMRSKAFPVIAAALFCFISSPTAKGEVRPYLGRNYEKVQSIVKGYRQEYHQGIRITGTPAYIARIRKALDLIEAGDGRNWYYVRKHVRRITLNGHPGMDIGGGRLTTASEEGVPAAVTAGSIVHDAWHRELFFAGRPWEGREAEIFCLGKQNAFLVRVGAEALDVEETLRSGYWKVDYWLRDW